MSLTVIWISFILHKLKKISFKFNSAIFAYVIFTNLIISNFYFYYHSQYFTEYFLICTIIFCINSIVVGFCSGHIHLFISAIYYIISYLLLLLISHDKFLSDNAFTLIIVVSSFSLGFSLFLLLLKKIHNEELDLTNKLHEKESQLLKMELETKHKELTSKALYLLEMVENNNMFVNKLKDFKKDINPSSLSRFDNIINEHQGIHSNKYWKEFETCFQEVHIDFYRNLQNKFPDLSPSERRMAAFIRLDLTTKQIADITFNTIHSIEVSRSRLRKKLNINVQTNLKDFLDEY
jgi:DNA-binding CsgD family transcriptional regulator